MPILIIYLTLHEQHSYIHIIYHFYIFVFGYYYMHAYDIMADSFRHVIILYSCFHISCLCLYDAMVLCNLVLRVSIGDTLPIIRTHSGPLVCDLELHRVRFNLIENNDFFNSNAKLENNVSSLKTELNKPNLSLQYFPIPSPSLMRFLEHSWWVKVLSVWICKSSEH